MYEYHLDWNFKKTLMYSDLVGNQILHPQATGYTWIWENEEVEESVISYVRYAQFEHVKSPALHLATGLKGIVSMHLISCLIENV